MQPSAERLEIEQLDDSGIPAWDAYVDGKADAALYHGARWLTVMRDAFDHECYFFQAKRDGAIEGVLPLIRLKSRAFGDYMVSLPAFNYGGVLADSAVTASNLLCYAADYANELGCTHLETRDMAPLPVPWVQRTNRITMLRSLPASAEELDKEIGTKLRAQVKRPIRAGATAITGRDELLDDFYEVFAQNMRDLGTPVYAKRFFELVLKANPDNAWISAVHVHGKCVAAGFLLKHRDRMEIPWASSLRKYNSISVNMLLYWECLTHSIAEGSSEFDFGRTTPGSNTHRFKRQWGAEMQQLIWHYWLAEGEPEPALHPGNPKFKIATTLWSMAPTFVTNRIGPKVVRWLP